MNSYPNRYFDSDEIFFLLTILTSKMSFDRGRTLDEFYATGIKISHFPLYINLLLEQGIVNKVDFEIPSVNGESKSYSAKKGTHTSDDIFYRDVLGMKIDRKKYPSVEYICLISNINDRSYQDIEINLYLNRDMLKEYLKGYFKTWINDKDYAHDNFSLPKVQIKEFTKILKEYKDIRGRELVYHIARNYEIDEYLMLLYFYICEIISFNFKEFYIDKCNIPILINEKIYEMYKEKYSIVTFETKGMSYDINENIFYFGQHFLSLKGDGLQNCFLKELINNNGQWLDCSNPNHFKDITTSGDRINKFYETNYNVGRDTGNLVKNELFKKMERKGKSQYRIKI